MNPTVFFSSKRGHTRRCAQLVSAQFGPTRFFPIGDVSQAQLLKAYFPICGTPTYGMGESEFRWISFLRTLPSDAVPNRKCAVFGLGDAKKHAATFAGGILQLTSELERIGFDVIGAWAASDYLTSTSPALCKTGVFPGLVLDEVNQKELTIDRIQRWTQQLKQEFGEFESK